MISLGKVAIGYQKIGSMSTNTLVLKFQVGKNVHNVLWRKAHSCIMSHKSSQDTDFLFLFFLKLLDHRSDM